MQLLVLTALRAIHAFPHGLNQGHLSGIREGFNKSIEFSACLAGFAHLEQASCEPVNWRGVSVIQCEAERLNTLRPSKIPALAQGSDRSPVTGDCFRGI